MDNKGAAEVLKDIDKAYRQFSKEEYKALEMAIKALEQMEVIEAIINSPIYIQEDVLRYKMICEVVKNDKRRSKKIAK